MKYFQRIDEINGSDFSLMRRLWLLLALAFIPLVYAARQQYELPRVTLQSSQRVFVESGRASVVVYSQQLSQFYVLGRRLGIVASDQVFVYNRQHQLINQFRVKQAKDMAVDGRGRVYLAGDRQVRVFDGSGKLIRSFPAPSPESIALLSDGRIVVGSPTDVGLVHIFDQSGRQLARFGRMKELDPDPGENRWLNKGKVVVGRDDEIYYLIKNSPAPSALKFSPEGNLILEFEIAGESIDLQTALARNFLASREQDDVGGFLIIQSAGLDWESGHMWVAFNGSSNSGVVYEYDPDGVKLREYNLLVDSRRPLASAVGICAARGAVYAVKQSGEAYRFDPAEPVEPDEMRGLALFQDPCPPETETPNCIKNCGGGITKDCKTALLGFIQTSGKRKVDPAGCEKTPTQCRAWVHLCDLGTGIIGMAQVTIECQDNDGDGVREGLDCDDTDPSVNPNQEEVFQLDTLTGQADCSLCTDGKDNDCDGLTDQEDPGCAGCSSTPIVIDTSGNGFDLTSAANGVLFDTMATGQPLQTAWIQADEAWLVLDRNGNGTIDDGAELFGTATPLSAGQRANNGFEALAESDVNGDGFISAADPIYAQLRLWHDMNHNGYSEANELILLGQANVAAIEVSYRESRRRDRHGNEFRFRAKVYESLSPPRPNRFAYDVTLTFEPTG